MIEAHLWLQSGKKDRLFCITAGYLDGFELETLSLNEFDQKEKRLKKLEDLYNKKKETKVRSAKLKYKNIGQMAEQFKNLIVTSFEDEKKLKKGFARGYMNNN